MSDDIEIPIPAAAEKYGVELKRLRGAVHTNRMGEPNGDIYVDRVQDDETLRRWVAKQRGQQP